jgi:hypothetical protein
MVRGEKKSFVSVIYQGVIRLGFDRARRIRSVISRDGEELVLNSTLGTNMMVEKWLQNLEVEIFNSMKMQLIFAYMDMDLDIP